MQISIVDTVVGNKGFYWVEGDTLFLASHLTEEQKQKYIEQVRNKNVKEF
ncbi:TPA: YhfG family protein [Streptococcus suis]